MNRTAKIVATFGLALGFGLSAAGCVVTARGHLSGSSVVAYEEPPPPRPEPVEVRAGFVWVKGKHEWRDGRWVWVSGHWERARAGYVWQDGRWEHRGGSWHWIDGQWIVSSEVVITNDAPRDRVRDHRDPVPPPEPPRERVRDHRDGNPPMTASSNNPDGSGVNVVVGGGHVAVQVAGPRQPPPPQRMESPGTRRGFVWVSGHYEWRNNAYAWIDGHWARARAKQVWIDGRWELQGDVYVWTAGHWGTAR